MEFLKRLLNMPCVSGLEKQGNSGLKYYMNSLFDEVCEDLSGNLTGYLYAQNPEVSTVMLCAHYDSIGLIVSSIEENGFVGFAPVGGVDPRILPGCEVVIHGANDIYGVIGIRPPHILTKEEMKEPETCKTLYIDTGISSERLKKIIKVGSAVTFKQNIREFGKLISASALDDRAGCYAVLRAAEKLRSKKLAVNLCVMLTIGEELGRKGAKTGSFSVKPDLAVVVDATFGKTPECGPFSASDMGKGPVICKGPVLSRRYTKALESLAKEKSIPYQTEAEASDPGTDAAFIEIFGGGTPCTMLSFPLRYMHTCIETVNSGDIENLIDLLAEYVLRSGEFLC